MAVPPFPWNALIAWPDWTKADPEFAVVNYSGGWWTPELPLSNLSDDDLSLPARSVSANPESTRFLLDLGRRRKIRVVYIPWGNWSLAAKWRVRAYSSAIPETGPTVADVPVQDSGWLDVYPVIYDPLVLTYQSENFWYLRMTNEQAKKVKMPAIFLSEGEYSARYLWVEIDDVDNPNGFIQLPEIYVAPGYQFSLNFAYGGSLAVEDPTKVIRVDSNKAYFDKRQKNRVVRVNFDYLPEQEVKQVILDMMTDVGVSGRVVWIENPTDLMNRHRTSFTGRMRNLSPITHAVPFRMGAGFEIEEVVS